MRSEITVAQEHTPDWPDSRLGSWQGASEPEVLEGREVGSGQRLVSDPEVGQQEEVGGSCADGTVSRQAESHDDARASSSGEYAAQHSSQKRGAVKTLGINRSNVRQIAAIGTFEALVGLIATACIGILVTVDIVRAVGIVLVWLSLIAAGAYYLTRKPVPPPPTMPKRPPTPADSALLEGVADDIGDIRTALTGVLDRMDLLENRIPISAPPPIGEPRPTPLSGIPALLSFIQQGEGIVLEGSFDEDIVDQQRGWMTRLAEWLRADPGDEVARKAEQYLLRAKSFRERVQALQTLAEDLCTLQPAISSTSQYYYGEGAVPAGMSLRGGAKDNW